MTGIVRSRLRTALATLGVLTLAVVLTAGAWARPAAAQTGGNDNAAVAINTKDGSSLFRFAFNVTRVTGETVDPTNAAVAYASCTDCSTVAIAIQVVIVEGSPDVFTPTNVAWAENVDCSLCVTMASAYQFVVQATGPVHLTADGERRLQDVLKQLRRLQDQQLTVDEMRAELDGLATAIYDIYSTQLVAAGNAAPGAGADVTATTVRDSATTTSTTESVRSSTTTTVTPSSTSSSSTTTTSTPTTTSTTAP